MSGDVCVFFFNRKQMFEVSDSSNSDEAIFPAFNPFMGCFANNEYHTNEDYAS